MFDVRELTKPRPGALCEPRVLWGMGLIAGLQPEDDNPYVSVLLPGRDSYLNGERWPIVLTHMITLAQSPSGFAFVGSDVVNQMPIELGGLGTSRYSVGQVRGLVSPLASGESIEPLDVLANDQAPLHALFDPTRPAETARLPQGRIRSVQNLVRWDFEHTLKLPPAAFVEMQLSGRVPTVIDTRTVPTEADVNFYASAPREGAQFPASALTRGRFAIDQLTVPAAQFYYNQAAFTGQDAEGVPLGFPVRPFENLIGGPQSQLYPSGQVFTSRQAVQQKATYDLPMNLAGMSVAFQQDALDRVMHAGTGTVPGTLAATTYARMRSRNGGTQNYWWRDGAPLAVCMPTITPGVVSKLDRPMALQPGEGFKLTLPRDFDPASLRLPFDGTEVGDRTRFPAGFLVYYISFCGYAYVEA
jgi:hypothetical protein